MLRHARTTRLRPKVVAPLVVSGFLILTAAVAAGFEPSQPTPIPDAAFRPVVLPSPSTGAPAGRSPWPSIELPVLLDPAPSSAPAERAQPSLPAPQAIVVPVATPTPRPATTHSISASASYYCRAGISPCTSGYPDTSGFDAYAAAGPALRRAIGSSWRGRIVLVDGIRVKLIDWCQCYEGQSNEKLLDLYYDVFARTGSAVTVRW